MPIAEATSMIGLQDIFGYLGKVEMPSRADFVEALANLGDPALRPALNHVEGLA